MLMKVLKHVLQNFCFPAPISNNVTSQQPIGKPARHIMAAMQNRTLGRFCILIKEYENKRLCTMLRRFTQTVNESIVYTRNKCFTTTSVQDSSPSYLTAAVSANGTCLPELTIVHLFYQHH